MAYYSRPEEVLGEFKERFDARKSELGLAYVALQEESLIPEYPAIQLIAGPASREIQTTSQFTVDFTLVFWVYHSDLSVGHATRSIEDMQLATGIVQYLHRPENRRLVTSDGENKLVFGFVTNEIPGLVQRDRGPAVIATRLTWNGTSVVNFGDS